MRRIRENEKSRDELAKWHMEFDQQVVQVPGTLLKTVAVHFGGNVVVVNIDFVCACFLL